MSGKGTHACHRLGRGVTEPVDGRLFAEEPERIPPPMEGQEAGEVMDDLGAMDREGGDEERLPIPPDRVVMLGRLLEVDGLGAMDRAGGDEERLPIPPDRGVMLGRLLGVDGLGETMRLPVALDRVVMLDRFMGGDTVLGMDRFARLSDECVILERFDSRDFSLAVVSKALGVEAERRFCNDVVAEILEDAETEETDGLAKLSEAV